MSVREEDADVSPGMGSRVHGVRCAPNSSRSLQNVCFFLITQEINETNWSSARQEKHRHHPALYSLLYTVAVVRGIPRNSDDITMKTSHINKVSRGSGDAFCGPAGLLLRE